MLTQRRRTSRIILSLERILLLALLLTESEARANSWVPMPPSKSPPASLALTSGRHAQMLVPKMPHTLLLELNQWPNLMRLWHTDENPQLQQLFPSVEREE